MKAGNERLGQLGEAELLARRNEEERFRWNVAHGVTGWRCRLLGIAAVLRLPRNRIRAATTLVQASIATIVCADCAALVLALTYATASTYADRPQLLMPLFVLSSLLLSVVVATAGCYFHAALENLAMVDLTRWRAAAWINRQRCR